MNAYILTWNPKVWDWSDLDQSAQMVQKVGYFDRRWSCGNTKKIKSGDRVFLIKLGTHPKGVMGAGYCIREHFQGNHWNGSGKLAWYIEVRFEILMNPSFDPILNLDSLKSDKLKYQNWTPQSSGISIRSEIVPILEKVWEQHINKSDIKIIKQNKVGDNQKTMYVEGAITETLLTKYERNPGAREQCIKIHGVSCSVCGRNFERKYGAIGRGYIHVHHLVQLADIGCSYEVDPETDLIPVCPNCHAMIHKRTPPYTIQEMKTFIDQTAQRERCPH